jgi:hypothetical protein
MAHTDPSTFRPGQHGRQMRAAAAGLGYFAFIDYRSWAELGALLAAAGIGPADLKGY